MSAVSRHLARRCAAQALYQWLVTRQSPADIEASFISDDEMEGCDVDYFRHLILNIPNYQSQIQEALAECVDRPVDQIDPVERAILLIGGYEILFRLDIPAGVATGGSHIWIGRQLSFHQWRTGSPSRKPEALRCGAPSIDARV